MAGIVPDGILVRLSTVADPSKEVFSALRAFAGELVAAVAPANRAVLVGNTLGQSPEADVTIVRLAVTPIRRRA